MENEKYLKNLTNFLKYFINRPNHLARYLLDNNAFDPKFLQSLANNKSIDEDTKSKIEVYFIDINQMNNFFSSLITGSSKNKDVDDLKVELSKELEICLKEERYEDAIRIRDYMKKLSKNVD